MDSFPQSQSNQLTPGQGKKVDLPTAGLGQSDWSVVFMAQNEGHLSTLAGESPNSPPRPRAPAHRRSLTRAVSEHKVPEEKLPWLLDFLSPATSHMKSARGIHTCGQQQDASFQFNGSLAVISAPPKHNQEMNKGPAPMTPGFPDFNDSPSELPLTPYPTAIAHTRQPQVPQSRSPWKLPCQSPLGRDVTAGKTATPSNFPGLGESASLSVESSWDMGSGDTWHTAGSWDTPALQLPGFSRGRAVVGSRSVQHTSTNSKAACHVAAAQRVAEWAQQSAEQSSESGEEEDELSLSAAVLRKLTRGPRTGKPHRRSGSFSWKGLELSCKKLDAAQIKISTLDLSLVDDDSDSQVVYNFQLESSEVDSTRMGCHSNVDSSPLPYSRNDNLPTEQLSTQRLEEPGATEKASVDLRGPRRSKCAPLQRISEPDAECKSSRTSESTSASSRELHLIGSCVTTPSTIGSSSINGINTPTMNACSHSAPRLLESEALYEEAKESDSFTKEIPVKGLKGTPDDACGIGDKSGSAPVLKGRRLGLRSFVQRLRGKFSGPQPKKH